MTFYEYDVSPTRASAGALLPMNAQRATAGAGRAERLGGGDLGDDREIVPGIFRLGLRLRAARDGAAGSTRARIGAATGGGVFTFTAGASQLRNLPAIIR
jgi:hypothetical protein